MKTRLFTILIVLTLAPAAQTAVADAEGPLSYVALMKLPFEKRFAILERLPEAERDAFIAGLPRDRRAVLLVDPADCGVLARTQRLSLANSDPSSAGANAVQDVGQSLAKGLLGQVLPGLGSAVSVGAKANEINQLRKTVDVCDMPPEERAALLEPVEEPPAKKEDSLLDKASKFFAR